MARRRGLSVRVKLALSYAGFGMLASMALLAVVWVFLLRYVPDGNLPGPLRGGFIPNRSDLLEAFLPKAVWMLLFVLLLGLVGGWFLAGRMLAPLRRIGTAARYAANGSLSHRIALAGPGDEFRELADVFDTMLASLEAHVAEQRRFAANASHELRTPLAISQAILDVARDDPAPDVEALVQRLGAVNARAIALTEALLLLSRADRRSFARELVDMSLVAEEAAETLLPLAERRGVGLDVVAHPARTVGSPALLSQLTTNLVQNAIVHNLPEGGTVWVRTGMWQGAVMLRVENTGGVVDPRILPTLTEPFQRGTERTHGGQPDHAGTGLGLAIVHSIARAHDARLTIAPRPVGGLAVTVELVAPR